MPDKDELADIRRIAKLYRKIMSFENDDDYIINEPQMEKFMKVLDFFTEEVARQGGSLESISMVPKETSGGITVIFDNTFDITKERIQEFSEVISGTSAMEFFPSIDDNVGFSCTVPNVFIHK